MRYNSHYIWTGFKGIEHYTVRSSIGWFLEVMEQNASLLGLLV